MKTGKASVKFTREEDRQRMQNFLIGINSFLSTNNVLFFQAWI